VQLALAVTHHDHDYVERRGGPVLYSHMRGASGRCRYRRRALERAVERYEAAAGEVSREELAGLGLLVMQRAHFAAEDLGGLLHTFDGQPGWERLAGVRLNELDAVYQRAAHAPGSMLAGFRLPSTDTIGAEARLSVLQKQAANRLVGWKKQSLGAGLQTVAQFWLHHRPVAKCTMHGFPVVAGSLVFGPPRAGKLAEGIRNPGRDPWALAVVSRADHPKHQVVTDRFVEPLDGDAIRSFSRAGKVAVRLTERLCAMQAYTIEAGYGYSIPLDLVHRLSNDERTAMEQLPSDDSRF
jgi:hypothetical protein